MNTNAVHALDAVRLAAASGRHRIALDGLDPATRQVLTVASDVGAPLSLAADIAHARLTHTQEVLRAVAVASAEARSVAGFLLLAPLVLLPLTGQVLDVSIWSFFTRPFGLGVLAVAGLLYAAGFAVIGQLRRGLAAPVLSTHAPKISVARLLAGMVLVVGMSRGSVWLAVGAVGVLVLLRGKHSHTHVVTVAQIAEVAEVVVLAATAGQSVPHALRCAGATVPLAARQVRELAFSLDCGVKPVGQDGVLGQFAAIAWQAHHDGAPAAAVFRQFAAQVRADEQAVLLARASRLSARLTVPTTLFFLPATVLVMVAPVMAHGLSALPW